jgi:diguanylate cyclase (GGDEF)-like protein
MGGDARSDQRRTPAEFSGELRRLLAEHGALRRVRAGEVLFRTGDEGDSMYLVEEGEVRLTFEEGKDGKILGTGRVFGELALLAQGGVRTGTAVALGEASLRVIARSTLDRLREECPQVPCTLLQEACSYLLTSEHELISGLRQRNRELEQALDFLRRTRQDLSYQELLAQTDDLTGLYNRRCFDAQLASFLSRARVESVGMTLLLFDLDRFKVVNDEHGHPAGDVVLRQVAAVTRATVRRADLPCRLGGDEFAVLLFGATGRDAVTRARALHDAIGELTVVLHGATVSPAASMGGAVVRADEDAVDLVKRADEYVYAAKRRGSHRFVFEGEEIDVARAG